MSFCLVLAACGGGADEVVAIQASGGATDGGLDDGLPGEEGGEIGGDEGTDSETSDGSETAGSQDEPLPKKEPEANLFCAPQPDFGLYSTCEAKSDCAETDSCFSWEGGSSICSNHCDVDMDCPAVTGCVASPSCVRHVCALRCSREGECPEGMGCGFLPALGLRLCM